jgi:hypothetical protein
MAADKPEILIIRLLDKIGVKFQKLCPPLSVPVADAPSPILSDATGSLKSKMAAAKPEVLISLPVYKIGVKFQRLHPFLSVPKDNGTIIRALGCNRK